MFAFVWCLGRDVLVDAEVIINVSKLFNQLNGFIGNRMAAREVDLLTDFTLFLRFDCDIVSQSRSFSGSLLQ